MPGYNGGAGGRPTLYNLDLANRIYELMVEGWTLTDICELDGMPAYKTVIEWIGTDKFPEFTALHSRAKVLRAHKWADNAFKRIHDESRDYYTDSKGERRSDNTAVQRDKLITETYKFLMARHAPKEYGDTNKIELFGKDGAPFQPVLNITIKKDE